MMDAALRFSQPSGKLAIRIAAFLTNPLDFLDDQATRGVLSDVNGHDLTHLAGVPFARKALNAFTAEHLELSEFANTKDLATKLRSDEKAVTALEWVLGDLSAFHKAKPYLIAAICQKEIMGALMKSDREAISEVLGTDARLFASREAGVFYANLGRLAPAAGMILRQADGTPFDSHPVAKFASDVTLAYLHTQDELAASIYAVRSHATQAKAAVNFTLDDAQQKEFRRLITKEGRA